MKKSCLAPLIATALATIPACLALGSEKKSESSLIFLGTYTNTTSRGIYATWLDRKTGALTAPKLVAETPNPSWVAFSPDRRHLFTVHPSTAQAAGFVVDAVAGALKPLPVSPTATEARPPSHLSLDTTGRALLTANYGEGRVDIMSVGPDGGLGPRRSIQHTGKGTDPVRQTAPHAHNIAISPDNRFALVCDLGLDRIFTYELNAAAATIAPAPNPFAACAPGSGPRHLRFGPDGRHAYVVNELAGTVSVFGYESATGTLEHQQTISTLPAGFTGSNTSAEVRVHPNGRYLYVSNRGPNTIAVLGIEVATGRLTSIESIPSGGLVPRNFALSPDGRWLVAANQDSDSLVVFRVDEQTGRLQQTEFTATVPRPTCVLFYD